MLPSYMVLELENILFDYSDEQLHAMAEEYAINKKNWTPEEQLEWAGILLLTGTLENMFTTMEFQAIDGCSVEIDGNCEHGYKSPMVLLDIA